MPGRGHRFTVKEDKQAKAIAKSLKSEGYSEKEAKSIGYATVQKLKKR